ncbi:hypothetical protein ANCCAN_08981 [Ancylostoma caninum]|uniref:Uncharacterized protein n=1 Tax=Ancylostoma caninum TaxID=29170 RepID=A0A368GN44_ANCCA|nr:hypothetical protein ANCCAN_08981 [Ancylostoma caninum]
MDDTCVACSSCRLWDVSHGPLLQSTVRWSKDAKTPLWLVGLIRMDLQVERFSLETSLRICSSFMTLRGKRIHSGIPSILYHLSGGLIRCTGLERPGVFTGDCGRWRSMAVRRVDTNPTFMGSQTGNPLSYVHYSLRAFPNIPPHGMRQSLGNDTINLTTPIDADPDALVAVVVSSESHDVNHHQLPSWSCRAAASHFRLIPPMLAAVSHHFRTTPPLRNVEPLNSVHPRAAALPRHRSTTLPSTVNAFDHATPFTVTRPLTRHLQSSKSYDLIYFHCSTSVASFHLL